MVFFQAVLLAGYLYAHRAVNKLGVRRQALFHMVLLAACILALNTAVTTTGSPMPVASSLLPDDQDYPILGLVALLGIAVGVPFFVLSATSPLLQRWFAASGHPSARDPYFLYAASNAGSLLGLLGYPLLLEPRLSLAEQQWVFAGAVTAYIVLTATCAAILLLRESEVQGQQESIGTLVQEASDTDHARSCPTINSPINAARVARWVFLAGLPSSLMLGVTTYVSTNLAPVPLLWAVPLSLYLISFILVFARWPVGIHRTVGNLTPVMLLFAVLSLLVDACEPFALIGVLHMGAFFGVCLVCHGELANDRPPAEHLTAFYFWLSVGGVLGGILNGLIAPLLFQSIGMLEYPLALVLAASVRPRCSLAQREPPLRFADVGMVLALLLFSVLLVVVVTRFVVTPIEPDQPEHWVSKLLCGGMMFGVPAVATIALLRRPARYALCLAAMCVAGAFDIGRLGETLHMERNFYGVVRVARSPDGKFIRLIHGTTVHGQQRTDEHDRPRPMTYYYEWGPVGRLFQDLSKRPIELKRVGVVGLGTGTVSYYAERGQTWTFFEIDPAVARVAQNPEYFRFLASCKGEYNIVLGDARRQLVRVPDESFDLLIIDGFCSDAIPVHLLTREAFALYFRKLTPNGVLAVNVTNPHLDLPPLITRTAGTVMDSLAIRYRHDRPEESLRAEGKSESEWMILGRSDVALGPVSWDPYWDRLTPVEGPVWRDDFANLLSVWKRGNH
jgi:spermidine synthase